MIYATLKTLHVLSIIVWIGGMVFAHFFLRPAVAQLEPAVRPWQRLAVGSQSTWALASWYC
jgi:uncharacterized membrane protein